MHCFLLEDSLNLPNYQVLPGFLEPDEHVVVVAVGNLTAASFVNTLPCSVAEKYSLDSPNIDFFIPLLTGPDPTDLPRYKLLLGGFVSTQKPFLNPNMAVPCEQVDKIVISENGVTMTDGDNYFIASWEEKEECIPANYSINAGIDQYLDELIVPFRGELDSSTCDANDVQHVDLCETYKQMQDSLLSSGFNACEYWTSLEQYTKCELESYTLLSISERFQEVSLLHDSPTSPIIYEIQHEAQFGANMKIPCML